jgi:hypothetical protein
MMIGTWRKEGSSCNLRHSPGISLDDQSRKTTATAADLQSKIESSEVEQLKFINWVTRTGDQLI